MSNTNNQRDSKPVPKEILLKFLVIGDYGVGKFVEYFLILKLVRLIRP